MDNNPVIEPCINLLADMVRTPSLSGEEGAVVDLIAAFLSARNVEFIVKGHNLWSYNRHFDSRKPTVLLNSHLDTVRPNAGYTRDPYQPEIADGKL